MRTYIEMQEAALATVATKKELEALTDRELSFIINIMDFANNLCRLEVLSRTIAAELKSS